MSEIVDITECPHCGSVKGVYRTLRFSGEGQYNYAFAGGEDPCNYDLHNAVDYHEHKTAFCLECDKPISGVAINLNS